MLSQLTKLAADCAQLESEINSVRAKADAEERLKVKLESKLQQLQQQHSRLQASVVEKQHQLQQAQTEHAKLSSLAESMSLKASADGDMVKGSKESIYMLHKLTADLSNTEQQLTGISHGKTKAVAKVKAAQAKSMELQQLLDKLQHTEEQLQRQVHAQKEECQTLVAAAFETEAAAQEAEKSWRELQKQQVTLVVVVELALHFSYPLVQWSCA